MKRCEEIDFFFLHKEIFDWGAKPLIIKKRINLSYNCTFHGWRVMKSKRKISQAELPNDIVLFASTCLNIAGTRIWWPNNTLDHNEYDSSSIFNCTSIANLCDRSKYGLYLRCSVVITVITVIDHLLLFFNWRRITQRDHNNIVRIFKYIKIQQWY